jgi:membrane associated rhomboid family serine protease
MFVPLHDDTPLKVIRFQFVTLAIIVGNVIIFLMTGAFQSDQMLAGVATSFGVVPADLTHAPSQNIPYSPIPEPLTFLTYMFLHAGWLHLISNMLFLWVFADNVEDAFGYFAFVLFYLLCGIAGALAYVMMSPNSMAPLIGASGAVSGVIGAYVLLYPKARIWILLFYRIPLRISAIWVLGGWFLLQVFSVLTAGTGGDVEVAWWAHIGGFAAGLVITLVLRSRLLIRTSG